MNISNPIIRADMPDPDLLRVGDTYYMVSTTMFFVPGAPVLRSKDLCHWEIVSYIFERMDDNDIYCLRNGKNAYGRGQWATSLTFYRGRFYACFVCHDMKKTYIYSTKDIEKSGWDRMEIDRVFHDMSFLFWEGRPYLVYGNGEIGLVELKEDLSGIQTNGVDRLLISTPKDRRLRCEGCRALVRNGYIYLLFIEWPEDGVRRQVCYRSRSLEGPFEERIIMEDTCGLEGCGVAQGTLTDSEDGEWYAMLFQDRGAVGRVPYLMHAHWEEDWPVLGENGRIPLRLTLPFEPYRAGSLMEYDSFAHIEDRLGLEWQWNHNPDDTRWSFTRRPGWLRLQAGRANSLLEARNTLTRRTVEPGCVCHVTLDGSGLREGDYAGMCAFQSRYGQIGMTVSGGKKYILAVLRGADGSLVKTAEPFTEDQAELRIDFDFRDQTDCADFYWRRDPSDTWKKLGDTLHMVYTLDLFVGYRVGLFCYSAAEDGGCADFCRFMIQPTGGEENG